MSKLEKANEVASVEGAGGVCRPGKASERSQTIRPGRLISLYPPFTWAQVLRSSRSSMATRTRRLASCSARRWITATASRTSSSTRCYAAAASEQMRLVYACAMV